MMTAALSGARGGVCAFSYPIIPNFGAIGKGYVREDFAVCQTSLLEAAGSPKPKPPNNLVARTERAAFGFANSADTGSGLSSAPDGPPELAPTPP